MDREEIKRRFEAIVEKTLAADAARRAKRIPRIGAIAPGDLFRLDLPDQTAIFWAVLLRDPDAADVWCVAPADDDETVGSCDLALDDDAPYGAMTLRLNHHLWVPAELLPLERRRGYVEADVVAEAQDMLALLARGRLVGSPWAEDLEETPSYEEVVARVARAEASLVEAMATLERPSENELDVDWRHLAVAGDDATQAHWFGTSEGDGCGVEVVLTLRRDGLVIGWRADVERLRRFVLVLRPGDGASVRIELGAAPEGRLERSHEELGFVAAATPFSVALVEEPDAED